MVSKYCAIVVVAVIMVLSAASCNGAVFTQPAAKHPDYPGKCFDKLTKRAMLPGKEYKPKGICATMTCEAETYNINVETCPYIDMPDCEELPVDPTRSYPKCCPQFLCTDENGQQTIVDVTTL